MFVKKVFTIVRERGNKEYLGLGIELINLSHYLIKGPIIVVCFLDVNGKKIHQLNLIEYQNRYAFLMYMREGNKLVKTIYEMNYLKRMEA